MSIKFFYERGAFEGWHDFHSVIVLDNSRIHLDKTVRCLKNAGFSVQGFLAPLKALDYLHKNPGNLVLLNDDHLKNSKKDLINQIHSIEYDIPFIVMSEKASINDAVSYMKLGAIDVISMDDEYIAFLPEVVLRSFKKLNTVSELERSKRALIDHEIELRKITENIDDIVIKTDLNGNCTFVSAAYERVFNRPVHEQVGEMLYRDIHHKDSKFVKTRIQNVAKAGDTDKFEFRMVSKSNQIIWLEASGSVIDHQGLRDHELLFVMRDVSHQKRMTGELEEERNFIQTVLDTVGNVVIVLDRTGKIIQSNKGCKRVSGYEEEELLGKKLWDAVIGTIDRMNVKKQFMQLMNNRAGQEFECQIQTKDHKNRIVACVMTYTSDQAGYIEYILFTAMDITERKESEAKLKESEELWQFALEGSGDGVRDWNVKEDIMQFSKRWRTMLGYKEDALESNYEYWLSLVHPEDREFTEKELHEHLNGHLSYYVSEYRIKCENQSYKWVLDRGKTMEYDDNNRPLRMVCTLTDITERKKIEQEIRYMSFHDKLTGVYNRAFFEVELKRLDTVRQLPISIIVGDVNGLKLVNDAFGHMEGDKLLISMSDILKNSCRSEDIIARIGGDEFAIILPNTDEIAANEVIKRIHKHTKENTGSPFSMSIALGLATKTSASEKIIDTHKIADDRMYQHKLVESKSFKGSLIASLKSTLQRRTRKAEGHSDEMQIMAERLGVRMGLTDAQQEELKLLALLHDIGKVAIPDQILNKPDALSDDEWLVMRKHPEIGFRIASTTPELSNIAEYILYHHERMDGKGYPKGLQGDEIPLFARVLAVLDAYDAMVSDRPYSKAMKVWDALDEIKRCSGKQFDPKVADQFVHMITDFENKKVTEDFNHTLSTS